MILAASCCRRFRRWRTFKYGVLLAICVCLIWAFKRQLTTVTRHDVITKKVFSQPRYQHRATSSTTQVSLLDALETMNRRRVRVTRVCQNANMREKSQELNNHTLVSRMHHFIYCPVEKSASTFWRRFLYQLEYTNPMQSPFDVSIPKAYDGMTRRVKIFETGKRLQRLLSLSTKVLFVRDPFSRLFSAFVDKLLSPNPVYWEKWGVPAIRKLRKTPGKPESSCGNDVTFKEFVQHVTEELWVDESHVMPIALMCDPCRFNYTVIGKLETFARDAGLVLAYLGVNESQVGFERMATDALSDAVSDALSEDWLKLTLRCVSMVEMARRIWRKLQLRGLISWKMNFELSPQDVASLQPGEFIAMLERAATDSTYYGDLGFQKKQAVLEAFKVLKPWQFIEILRIFKTDFLMFGYNFTQFVDEVHNVQTTGALDWERDWDLSALV